MNANHHFDKNLVYNHPLFRLLIVIFNKCELATNSTSSIGSVDEDIFDFIKQFNQEQRQCLINNSEIDDLMIQIIEVLRFHYLEIEKVHELCENFCERYIHLLKNKFTEDINSQDMKFEEEEDTEDNSILSLPSAIESEENFESDPCEENNYVCQSRQRKRGMFPKSATSIMRTWLFQHLTHPYPSEDEKKLLAKETNLNILQVNNWFINARRRIVQPMIDQSNRAPMIGTEYNDLMAMNSYQTFDFNSVSHTFPTDSSSMYSSPTTITHSTMHFNPFFPSTFSTANEMASIAYLKQENDDYEN